MGPGGRFATRMIGNRMVVVDTTVGLLRVLNPSATALWLLLEEAPAPRESLADAFGTVFSLTRARAAADVEACLDTWVGYGWLRDLPDGRIALEGRGDPLAMAVADRLEPWVPGAPLPDHTIMFSRPCRLRHAPFVVTLAATSQAGFPEILPRIAAFLGGFPRCGEAADAPEVRMVVGARQIVVRWPGGTVATGDGSAGVARLVLAIYELAYPEEAMVATMHAAALHGPRGTILMPGRSGNGKSTLSAHLAGRGWHYLADDSIGLAARGSDTLPTVLPFPSALGLKPPTWPILAARFPALGSLPTVDYAGKTARFLALTRTPLPDREACVPCAIVFPRFISGDSGRLVPLEPHEVMAGVAEAGLRTGERLDSGRIDRVLAFLEAVPAFAMSFGDLDWAEETLAAL